MEIIDSDIVSVLTHAIIDGQQSLLNREDLLIREHLIKIKDYEKRMVYLKSYFGCKHDSKSVLAKYFRRTDK